MATLEEICKSVIEAGKTAQELPWKYVVDSGSSNMFDGTITTASGQEFLDNNSNDTFRVAQSVDSQSNLEYIVTSANHAVQIAKALLVMREALGHLARVWCADTCHCDELATLTLQQAEEIMRGDNGNTP